MARQGSVVHCEQGHEIPWSQLPADIKLKARERMWCGDEEIGIVPEFCDECKKLAANIVAQPELARAAD